ncbi:unannotated protein [freshwater metagenome]|uniref:Unannotated protein n=1 Tax=freshwater metagenome TaxID=449393 RepID=A0A6J7NL63_9ZZZZ
MCTTLRFVQAELGAASNHLDLMIDVMHEGFTKVQRSWNAVYEGHKIGCKSGLQRCVLVQVVEEHVGGRISLQFNDQSGHASRSFVANLPDSLNHPSIGELCNLLFDGFDRGLIGDLGDNNAVPFGSLFNLCFRPHFYGTTACTDGRDQTSAAHNLRARRKVGALHKLHQVIRSCLGIINQVQCCIDDLTEIVRRNIRCHSHCNALAAIHQQVREPARQNLWLLSRTIKVR